MYLKGQIHSTSKSALKSTGEYSCDALHLDDPAGMKVVEVSVICHYRER
jgi:hypothetical protein